MIRHVVLFAWKPGTNPGQVDQIVSELRNLAATIPAIRSYSCGPDAGIVTGNFDFAVTADFDDEAGFLSYRDDPGHRDIVQRLITPIAAQRAAAQFEF